MLIKFKNKMTMSLTKMIEDGNRLGGMPSHIEVSPNEAKEIFNELRKLNPANYTITSKESVSCKLLLQVKELSDFELTGYLAKWKEGEWKVEYKKIPVYVIDPTPTTMHLHS